MRCSIKPGKRFNYLDVTEGDGRFIGAISLHDIKNYLNAPELAELVLAGDISREDIPIIHPSASLNEALERFAHLLAERLPVVSDGGDSRVGSLAKTGVILALARQRAARRQPPFPPDDA